MRQSNNHFRLVNLWVEQHLRHLVRSEIIQQFDEAFGRVWAKAELTLGSVTIQAVADRIIHVGHEQFPWLKPELEESGGLRLKGILRETAGVNDEDLTRGLSFLLGEFLTVLGSLTAEIISSKLHAALLDGTIKDTRGGKK